MHRVPFESVAGAEAWRPAAAAVSGARAKPDALPRATAAAGVGQAFFPDRKRSKRSVQVSAGTVNSAGGDFFTPQQIGLLILFLKSRA